LQRQEWKRIERERRKVDKARQIVEAARRNEQQWPNSKLKEHYEKLWAEAAAKAKADQEELTAMRAAAMAQAAARKSPESTAAEQDAQAAESEVGKKPSEAVSGERADLEAAHRELAQGIAELERRLHAKAKC
jgi:hypothetical protein